MSATRDSTLHDPKVIIIGLQRQLADVQRTLDERTAEINKSLTRRERLVSLVVLGIKELDDIFAGGKPPMRSWPVFDRNRVLRKTWR